MSIFRSEDMYLYKIVMGKDSEKAITHILGNRNIAQFVNMNAHEQVYNLPYMDLIKKCEETERKVLYLQGKCQHFYITLKPAQSPEQMQELLSDYARFKEKGNDLLFDQFEKDISKAEEFVKYQFERANTLHTESQTLIEHYNVVKRAGKMIYGAEVIDMAF